MSTDDQSAAPAEPGFLARLRRAAGRFLLALVKVVLLLVVVAILAAGAWMGYQELNRSLKQIIGRTDNNSQRIDLLRSDVDSLITNEPGQQAQLGTLESEAANLDGRLSGVEGDLANDLVHQAAMLATLEAQVAGLDAGASAITQSVASLSEGLATLQDRVDANDGDLSQVAGDLESLQSDVAQLGAEVATPASEIARIQQAMILFRAWEMVARARLRLAENNPGLAAADVELALLTVNAVLEAGGPDTNTESLQVAQQRLFLATANLPGDLAAAGRDLETAWEALDAALAELIGLPALPATTPVPATPAVTPTLVVTVTLPAPTTTPVASPTP